MYMSGWVDEEGIRKFPGKRQSKQKELGCSKKAGLTRIVG